MKKDIKRIVAECWRIVDDRVTSKALKLEALRVLAACSGVWVGTADETLMDAKTAFSLRQARQQLIGRALGRKAARTRANRRNYLRRKIRTLELLTAQAAQGTVQANRENENESTVTE